MHPDLDNAPSGTAASELVAVVPATELVAVLDVADLVVPADDAVTGDAAIGEGAKGYIDNHAEPRLDDDELADSKLPAHEADLELPADDDIVGGAAATGDDGDVTSRSLAWNHSEPRLTADELPVN